MERNAAAIEVTISGEKGSGKSVLLNLIGSILSKRGLDVHCFEEKNKIIPHEQHRHLDNRKVLVTTTDVGIGKLEGERNALEKMLRRLCSNQDRTAEQVSKDWEDARSLLKSIR